MDRRRPRWRQGGRGVRIRRQRAEEIERDSSDSLEIKSQRPEGKEEEEKVPERIDEEFCIEGEGWRWLQ